MGEIKSLEHVVRDLTALDSSYAADAYFLVHETVTSAFARQTVRSHLGAEELVDFLQELARKEYGPLAKTVLAHWGMTGPEDVGNIVYKLIGAQIFCASPDDSPENFQRLTRWFPEEEPVQKHTHPLPRMDL